jgi:hypothetical protein
MNRNTLDWIKVVVVLSLLGIGAWVGISNIVAAYAHRLDVFEGCENPKVVTTTSDYTRFSSGYGSTTVHYIYRCDDGREIDSTIPAQDVPR